MAFSTSGGVRAWRFEDLNVTLVAKRKGWRSNKDLTAGLAALKKQQGEPAWIDATLARLPVPALAVLAALVQSHGHESDEEILVAAARTFQIPRDELVLAASLLLEEILICELTGPRGQALSLITPSAQLIAARLRDVHGPTLPTGVPFVPVERVDDGRALLAACGALRHVDVKLTQDGLPHRGAIKRVAKSIGIGEDSLEPLVTLGVELRVLAPIDDDGLLRPDVSRLGTLARGGPLVWLPVLSKLVETLRSAAVPVPTQRVVQWRREASIVTYSLIPDGHRLGSLPGFASGRCGDVDAIRAVPLVGAPAATITPSFEVFVPPDARHEDIVAVLECAELVRIDRVIVARITKGAIQRAVASGASAASLVASLSGACKTPVPQNVAAAIDDWCIGQHAVTAVGRVIVVPTADEARVVAALAPYHARVIAPGVILVRAEVSQRLVTTALARLGITTRPAQTQGDDRDSDEPMVSIDRLPPLTIEDSALARRFIAYRDRDPAELAKIAALAKREKPVPMPAPSRAMPPDEPPSDLSCSDRAIGLVEHWEDEHNCRLPDDVAGVVASLLDVIPDVDQRYLLAAKNRRQIIERTTIVMNQRGGLEAFLAKNRDLVARTVPPEVLDLVAATRPQLSPSPSAAAGSVDWYSDDLAARLAAAAGTSATYTLDLGGSRAPTVRIGRVIARGRVTMVLGEDVVDDSPVAVPLNSIRRIGTVVPATRSPWRPPPGQQAPAGHLPCPCGSGERYRACCRPRN